MVNMAMRRMKKKTTAEMLWPHFLKLLRDKPMHVYELRQQVFKRFGWKPPTVTAYIVLHTLQRDGYVTSEWQDQPGKPPKKCYRITKKGQELLREGIKYLKEFVSEISD
jgi:DNA-binding PadR family transcriptional regulator